MLAAGAGTRFSGAQSKLLADLDGRPVLEWALAAPCAVPALARVVVVLGSRADEVLARVALGRAEPVVCAEWADGQSASLRYGLSALEGFPRVIVTLGDQPRLTAAVVERFVSSPPGTRAVFAGRLGHPVVLGPEQIAALGSVRGDQGARGVLAGGPTVEVGHLCSGRDVDTLTDLEAMRGRG